MLAYFKWLTLRRRPARVEAHSRVGLPARVEAHSRVGLPARVEAHSRVGLPARVTTIPKLL